MVTLRMLLNNLDPEVAKNPEELIVHAGSGKAARNWACFDGIGSRLSRARGRWVLGLAAARGTRLKNPNAVAAAQIKRRTVIFPLD